MADRQPNPDGSKSKKSGGKSASNKGKQKVAEAGASQKEGKTKAELKAERRAKQVKNCFNML